MSLIRLRQNERNSDAPSVSYIRRVCVVVWRSCGDTHSLTW